MTPTLSFQDSRYREMLLRNLPIVPMPTHVAVLVTGLVEGRKRYEQRARQEIITRYQDEVAYIERHYQRGALDAAERDRRLEVALTERARALAGVDRGRVDAIEATVARDTREITDELRDQVVRRWHQYAVTLHERYPDAAPVAWEGYQQALDLLGYERS